MFRLIKAKYDGTCSVTGKSYEKGNLIFWSKFPKATVLASNDPEGLNDSEKRSILKRAPIQYLQEVCFSRGICSAHGKRNLVYHARKDELVSALMGEEVEWVDRRLKSEGTEKTQTASGTFDPKELENLLNKMLEEKMNGSALEGMIEKVLKSRKPREVVVKRFDGKKKKVGVQHKDFEKVLKYVSAGVNTYLVGPAGTGKTFIAWQIAEALGIPFYSESLSQQTPVYDLMGFNDSHGKYNRTGFRDAFEHGGIFLLDEVDKGNPNTLAKFNAATAADVGQPIAFPDGMIKRHKNFIAIAAANTYGLGADNTYVGSFQIDGATRDRFAFMELGIDEALEEHICRENGYDLEWMRHVQKIRKAVEKLNKRLIVSPRSTFTGSRLLAQGIEKSEVEFSCVWRGLNEKAVNEVKDMMARI